MKNFIVILLAILKSKLFREVAIEAIDMVKRVIAVIKVKKQDGIVTSEEKKEIAKIGLKEFSDIVNKAVENL